MYISSQEINSFETAETTLIFIQRFCEVAVYFNKNKMGAFLENRVNLSIFSFNLNFVSDGTKIYGVGQERETTSSNWF